MARQHFPGVKGKVQVWILAARGGPAQDTGRMLLQTGPEVKMQGCKRRKDVPALFVCKDSL